MNKLVHFRLSHVTVKDKGAAQERQVLVTEITLSFEPDDSEVACSPIVWCLVVTHLFGKESSSLNSQLKLVER